MWRWVGIGPLPSFLHELWLHFKTQPRIFCHNIRPCNKQLDTLTYCTLHPMHSLYPSQQIFCKRCLAFPPKPTWNISLQQCYPWEPKCIFFSSCYASFFLKRSKQFSLPQNSLQNNLARFQCLFVCLFIDWFESKNHRVKREKWETSHYDSLCKWLQQREWAGVKSEGRSYIGISHMGGRDPCTWTICLDFLIPWAERLHQSCRTEVLWHIGQVSDAGWWDGICIYTRTGLINLLQQQIWYSLL